MRGPCLASVSLWYGLVALVVLNACVNAIFFDKDDDHPKKAIHIVKPVPYPVHIYNKVPGKLSCVMLTTICNNFNTTHQIKCQCPSHTM